MAIREIKTFSFNVNNDEDDDEKATNQHIDDMILVDGVDKTWLTQPRNLNVIPIETKRNIEPTTMVTPVHALKNRHAFVSRLSDGQSLVYDAMESALSPESSGIKFIFVDGKSGCGKTMLLKRFLLESVKAERQTCCFCHKLNNINTIAQSIGNFVHVRLGQSPLDNDADANGGQAAAPTILFSTLQRMFYRLADNSIEKVETPDTTIFDVECFFRTHVKPSLCDYREAQQRTKNDGKSKKISIAVDEYALIHPASLAVLVMMYTYIFGADNVTWFFCGSADQLPPIGVVRYQTFDKCTQGDTFTTYQMYCLPDNDNRKVAALNAEGNELVTSIGTFKRNVWVGSLRFCDILRATENANFSRTFTLDKSFRITNANDPLQKFLGMWPSTVVEDTNGDAMRDAALSTFVATKPNNENVASQIFLDEYVNLLTKNGGRLDLFEPDFKIIVAKNEDCWRTLVRFGVALYKYLLERGVPREVAERLVVRTRAPPYMLIVGLRYSLATTLIKPDLVNGTTIKIVGLENDGTKLTALVYANSNSFDPKCVLQWCKPQQLRDENYGGVFDSDDKPAAMMLRPRLAETVFMLQGMELSHKRVFIDFFGMHTLDRYVAITRVRSDAQLVSLINV